MKRFLVCLDTSSRAPGVLAAAADLAVCRGAKLVLLRVIGLPPPSERGRYVYSLSGTKKLLVARATKELALLAEHLPAKLVEDTVVRIGAAWDVICREAEARACDLVVLGSQGHSVIHQLLGTTAAKVVNRCERSVLVVRPR